MPIPEHIYKDLEHQTKKRDALATELEKAMADNKQELAIDIQSRLAPTLERMERLNKYIDNYPERSR